MRLLAEVTTLYRCADCGTVLHAWPEEPCCTPERTTDPQERLLTPEDVAERCQVTPQTVRTWINSGRLSAVRPAERVVRVRVSALEEFWRQSETSA